MHLSDRIHLRGKMVKCGAQTVQDIQIEVILPKVVVLFASVNLVSMNQLVACLSLSVYL